MESNSKKIAEHRHKYEKLHKAREQRKAEFASLLKDGMFTGFRVTIQYSHKKKIAKKVLVLISEVVFVKFVLQGK